MRNALRSLLLVPMVAVAVAQTTPRLSGTVDLTIGGTDDSEEYSFGRIVGMVIGPDERIYVADGQDQKIRVYSKDGKYAFSIGGKGSGPGEFLQAASMAFSPDGALWIRDEGNSRYESFIVGPASATFKRTVRMVSPSRNGRSPLVFDAQSNPVEVGRPNGIDADPYAIVRSTIGADSKTIAADTFPGPPQDSTGVRFIRKPIKSGDTVKGYTVGYLYQPFGGIPLFAYNVNGDMARAMSSTYSIGVRSLSGKSVRVIARAAQGPEPTAAERAAAEQQFDAELKRLDLTRATAPFKAAARRAPLSALQFSVDGELWAQRTTAKGQPREADVYDRSGRLIAVAQWPEKYSLIDYRTTMRNRAALIVAKDSLDVERVLRVRFK